MSKNGTIQGYAEDVHLASGDTRAAMDNDNFITKVFVSNDDPADATIHGIQTSCPLLLDPDSTVTYQVEAP